MSLTSDFKKELKACLDPLYFAKHILKFDLFPMQAQIIKEFYQGNYNELTCVIGMRGGKTKLAAVISLYEAFKLIQIGDPAKHYGFAPGQAIFITNTATSERQAADTIFAADKELVHHAPYFQGLTETGECKERYNEIIFPDPNVTIRSGHANSSSLVGLTAKLVLFDELARFKDTKGNASGWNVYHSMSRSVKSFGEGGFIVSISSPVTVDDVIMTLYEMSKHSEHMLGYQLPTWEMNPNITREILESEFEKNPDMAQRDYGAEPSLVIENYYKDPQSIDKCIDPLRPDPVLPNGELADWFRQTSPEQKYFLAGDPAVKNDAFGLALVHFQEHKCIVDLVHRFKPERRREIDAFMVAQFIITLAERFPGIISFTTDVWNYPETLQRIEKAGVRVVQNHTEKKEHDRLKELIYGDMISFYLSSILVKELKELELIRGTKVDHRKTGSKDVADALANAVSAAGTLSISPKPRITSAMHVDSPIYRRSFGARGVVKVVV